MDFNDARYRFTKDKPRVKFYSFTYFADCYDSDGDGVSTVEDNLKEIETVVKSGYVTTMYVNPVDSEKGRYKFQKIIEICKKYDVPYWLILNIFKSSEQSLDEYMSDVENLISIIKDTPDGYELLCGFYWDEPFNKGITNDDFFAMTQSLYKKYHKRIYPVFSTNTLNERVIKSLNLDRHVEAPEPWALKYVTDAGGNNYCYDVRDAALNSEKQNARFAFLSKAYEADIKCAKDYYRYAHDEIMSKFDHPVNFWYYPTAYNSGCYTEEPTDEDYCVEITKYFYELLEETTKTWDYQLKGGFAFFTYHSRIFHGLAKRLPITIDSNPLCREEGFEEKWYRMNEFILELVKKYNKETENVIYLGLNE